MQKIPEELQHKIDYINAFNITASKKAACIAAATVHYWAKYYGDVDNGSVTPNKSITDAIKEVSSIGVQPSKPWPQNSTNPDEPLKPRPKPSAMPPKRIVDENVKLCDFKEMLMNSNSFCKVSTFVLYSAIALIVIAILESK